MALTGWKRNKIIPVNGTTAGAQSDYPMKLLVAQGSGTDSPGIVYCNGHIQSNFNDLRFTKPDQETLLNYWIESITGISPNQIATVWIRFAPSPDTIPASPGVYNSYMYYDNPSATGVSSWDNTILPYTDALVTSSAAWATRFDHRSELYGNSMWLSGGQVTGGGKDDVWSSNDGASWSQTNSGISVVRRLGHGFLNFNGKLWVLGGGNGSLLMYNDVWNSTDGINWTFVGNAGWSARRYFASYVYNGYMWIAGGQSVAPGNPNQADVWYSSDGITWTQATASAAFGQRGYAAYTVFDNKMWLFGGKDNAGNNHNDVYYSVDGITWTLATASANWSARRISASVTFDGRMWIVGGFTTGPVRDVWYSVDGINWTQATSTAGWSARYSHALNTFNDSGIWLLGGFDTTAKNDVWKLLRKFANPEPTFGTPVDLTVITATITGTYQFRSRGASIQGGTSTGLGKRRT